MGHSASVEKWRGKCRPRGPLSVVSFLIAVALLLLTGDILADKVLRVGVFQVEPLTYVQNGHPGGLFVEILEEVAQERGWSLEYRTGTFEDVFAQLDNGELDLMPTVAWSESRTERLDFNEQPVITVWGELFVRRGTPTLKLRDLAGKRVALMRADINGMNFQAHAAQFGIACEFVEFDSLLAVFEAIRDETVVGGVAPNVFGYRNGAKFGIVGSPIVFSPIPVHFAAKSGRSREVLTAIDLALAKWKEQEDSFYQKRLAYWFGGEELTQRVIPAWVPWGLSAVFGLAVGLLLHNRVLGRRMRARTRQLAQSERRFRALFDNQFQLSGLLSPEGDLLEANAASLDLIGAKEEDVKGQPFWQCPWWNHDPELMAKVRSAVKQARTGQFVRFDATHITPDGKRREVDFSITPVFDVSGKVELLVPEGRDISERRQLEDSLRQAQKLEAIGTLAGGIAHDFNNILTVIVGNAELLKMEIEGKDSMLHQLVDNLMQGGERARELVQQILTFSRKRQLERGHVQLADVLEQTLPLLRASLPATILIEQSVTTRGAVVGDATELQRILMNLATNALHAMPDGGTLSFQLSEAELERGAEGDKNKKPGRYAVLQVSDTGSGIEPRIVSKIFEPYFSTKDASGGTGLGLAVVHGLVRELGGWIKVETKLRHGTQFEVWLPLDERETQQRAAPRERISPLGNERILVLDDEAGNVRVMTRGLSRLGYRVDGFEDSEHALLAFAQSPGDYDAVLLDLTMPKRTGIELATEMRKVAGPGLVIMVYSGLFEERTMRALEQVPVDVLLDKPVSPAQVARALRVVLLNRQTSSQATHAAS